MKDNFLIDKNAIFSLDLTQFKPNVGKDDYIYFLLVYMTYGLLYRHILREHGNFSN